MAKTRARRANGLGDNDKDKEKDNEEKGEKGEEKFHGTKRK